VSTALYIDCDGTLCTLSSSYEELVAIACQQVGVEADPGPLAGTYSEGFFDAFTSLKPDPYLRGSREAFAEHDIDGDPYAFAEALVTAEIEHTVVEDDVVETLDSLAENASLGVLTNGVADVQRRKLEHHGLFERFDVFLPSYEVGSHKPDPAIFEAARERLPAEEYIYVGDSLESDIEPAREAGFLPVHLDRSNEARALSIDRLATLSRAADLF